MSPTWSVVLRFTWFLLSRLFLVCCVIGLVLLSFYAAMDYMNVQVLTKDGLNLRADVIIKGDDPTPLSRMFTKNFLDNDVLLYSDAYRPYIVSSYDYKAHIDFALIWPWQNAVTLRVSEQVSKIRAELFVMTESGLGLSETAPEWDNAIYDVTLMRYEDNWRIVSMELVELLPKPSPTPTPIPTPTPTLTPTPSPIDTADIIED